MRREAWLPLLLIAVACNGPEKDHDHDTDHDTEDVTDDGNESVLCSTAPQLAADGAVTSFDVTWSYDEADGLSFGEPILEDACADVRYALHAALSQPTFPAAADASTVTVPLSFD